MQGIEGLAMKAARLTVTLVAAGLAGCSMSTASLTTGSLFGSGSKPEPQAPANDPTARAFQVGTVSARAIKCGFNFDPAKLKNNYLGYERVQSPAADLQKIERTYDVSFNAVAKAVAGEKEYCTGEKTATIKADLTRHLAGDYTPGAPPKKQEEDDGIFGGMNWGSGDSEGMKQTLPTDNSNI
jgi:hypothetical protein